MGEGGQKATRDWQTSLPRERGSKKRSLRNEDGTSKRRKLGLPSDKVRGKIAKRDTQKDFQREGSYRERTTLRFPRPRSKTPLGGESEKPETLRPTVLLS